MKSKLFTARAILRAVSSQYFFLAILALFVIQALWIALTGLYPMAFDEDFHLGVIRLYADHPSPFWSAHPAAGDAFGAVARDPSYVFHWLMSFPYRFLGLITDNQSAQVIALRLVNIGFFAWGIFLFRRLLLMTKASKAVVHIGLLLFVLLPIVPLLAAHINYDNVIVPLTAMALILTIQLQQSFKPKRFDALRLLQLIAVCLLASVIKYAFLPVFIAIVGYLLVRAWQVYTHPVRLWRAFVAGAKQLKGWGVWALVGLTIMCGVLFAERYAVNVVRYHTPVPDCAQVLTYDECQYYGPWIRDYKLEASKGEFDKSPIAYVQLWAHGMWYRTFFAVDGPTTRFQTRAPMLLPGLAGITFVILGLLAIVLTARQLWKRYDSAVLWLFAAALVAHVGILWLQQYQLYLQAGKAVAVNGRYLIPLLPLFVLLVLLAVNQLLGTRRHLKIALAIVTILGFAWGGGAATYILRSNDAWYWNDSTVRTINQTFKRTFGPITPGNSHPTEFLP